MAVTFTINQAGVKAVEDKGLAFVSRLADETSVEARQRAPVRTGRLRNSIQVLSKDRQKDGNIGGNTVIADTPYANRIEVRTHFMTDSLNAVIDKVK